MGKPRFRKSDIQFHSDMYRAAQPAINIKVRDDPRKLTPYLAIGCDYRFTWDWIDEHVSDDDQSEWWWDACNNLAGQLVEDAQENLFPGEKFYTEGRSGGWLVMHGYTRSDVEGWDAIMVSRWGQLVKFAGYYVADVGRMMLELIYINVFLPWKDKQDELEIQKAQVAGGQA